MAFVPSHIICVVVRFAPSLRPRKSAYPATGNILRVPSLPAGWHRSLHCLVIGTPQQLLHSNYTISATNTYEATETISIAVNASAVNTTNELLPTAISYSEGTTSTSPKVCYPAPSTACSISPSGGTGQNVVWSVTPALGSGLSLNTSTGEITGNVSGTADTGVAYTVTAQNSVGAQTATLYIRRAGQVSFTNHLKSLFTQPLVKRDNSQGNAAACIFCHSSGTPTDGRQNMASAYFSSTESHTGSLSGLTGTFPKGYWGGPYKIGENYSVGGSASQICNNLSAAGTGGLQRIVPETRGPH